MRNPTWIIFVQHTYVSLQAAWNKKCISLSMVPSATSFVHKLRISRRQKVALCYSMDTCRQSEAPATIWESKLYYFSSKWTEIKSWSLLQWRSTERRLMVSAVINPALFKHGMSPTTLSIFFQIWGFTSNAESRAIPGWYTTYSFTHKQHHCTQMGSIGY